jgi:hypothetical protein
MPTKFINRSYPKSRMGMSKVKKGLGVYQLSNDKYVVEIGQRIIGQYNSVKEAATAYNKHISKMFTFPVYNHEGELPETEVTETKPVLKQSQEAEFNKPLKEYLAKQSEKKEEPSEETKEETNELIYIE